MLRRRGNLTRESYNLILLLVFVERNIWRHFFLLPKEVGGQVIRSKRKKDVEKLRIWHWVEFYPLERKKLFDIFFVGVVQYTISTLWCLFPFSFFFGKKKKTRERLEGTLRNAFSSGPDCRSTLPSGVEVLLLLSPIFLRLLLLLFFSTRFKQSDTHTFFGNFQKKL